MLAPRKLCLLLFLLLLAGAYAKKSQVAVLTDTLWEAEINNPTVDLWIVSFYAPW